MVKFILAAFTVLLAFYLANIYWSPDVRYTLSDPVSIGVLQTNPNVEGYAQTLTVTNE